MVALLLLKKNIREMKWKLFKFAGLLSVVFSLFVSIENDKWINWKKKIVSINIFLTLLFLFKSVVVWVSLSFFSYFVLFSVIIEIEKNSAKDFHFLYFVLCIFFLLMLCIPPPKMHFFFWFDRKYRNFDAPFLFCWLVWLRTRRMIRLFLVFYCWFLKFTLFFFYFDENKKIKFWIKMKRNL